MLTAMVLAATIAGAATPGASNRDQALPASQPTVTREAPLAEAIAHFQKLEGYRVTIHSFHGDGEEFILYYYKKPGWVRMEFIKPHRGALLVYSPKTGRVRLWPFGHGHFPELDLSPTNPLIRSPRGQYVNHSDVGALFENTRKLQESGGTEVLGEDTMNGHAVLHLLTTGAPGYAVDRVHSIEMWLEIATGFPRRIVSRDRMGVLIEAVTLDQLELDPQLPDNFFNP